MIRILFVILFLLCFLIFGLIPYMVIFFLYRKDPTKRKNMHQAMVRWAFRIIVFISGTDIDASGMENIPTDTAVLFMGNHRGYFDTVTTYVNIPISTGFVSKTEMEHIPLLSFWMRSIGCVFLERKDPKKAITTILQGVNMLKEGQSLFIFPEGTRGIDYKLAPFKEGSTKLATKAGVPIIPVAIWNTEAVLEKNGLRGIRPAKVKVQFGEPVWSKDFDRKEVKHIGAYVQAVIEKMLVG